MRRAALWLLLSALLAGAFLVPLRGGTVEVAGDGAPAVAAALEALDVAPNRRTEILLLRRIENLRHLPEAARLCRGDCTAPLTAIRVPRLGGPRTVLVVDLSGLDGVRALDEGNGLPPDLSACIATALSAEVEGRPDPGCLRERRVLWRLPFGL